MNDRLLANTQEINFSDFFDFPTLFPWFVLLPITFFFLRKCYDCSDSKKVLVAAQLYEALSMPYLLLVNAILILYGILDKDLSKFQFIGGINLAFCVFPGLIFAVSYIITRQYDYVRISKPISKPMGIFIFTVPWILCILWWLSDISILPAFFSSFDLRILIFTPTSLLFAFILGRLSTRPTPQTIADISLVNTLFYLLVSLSYWLGGGTDSSEGFIGAIAIGCTGLITGASIYQAAYWWSLTDKHSTTIEIRTKNWHFLEALTVFYFFVFAPDSPSSVEFQKESNETVQNLRVELREVQNATVIKIDQLSIYSTQNSEGLICGRATNTGNLTATGVEAKIDPHLSPDWEASYYYATERAILFGELSPGTSKRACTALKTLNKKDNSLYDYEDLVPNYGQTIHLIEYTVSYAEDSAARSDYKGNVRGKDIISSDTTLVNSPVNGEK